MKISSRMFGFFVIFSTFKSPHKRCCKDNKTLQQCFWRQSDTVLLSSSKSEKRFADGRQSDIMILSSSKSENSFVSILPKRALFKHKKWDHLFYSKRFCSLLPFLFLEFAKNLYCCFLLLGHYCTHSNFASVRGLCFIVKLKRHC